MRAWRSCGCTWLADLYVDGRRTFTPVGSDERAARVAHHRMSADTLDGRAVRRVVGGGFAEVARDWLALREDDPDVRANSLASWRTRVRQLEEFFGDEPVDAITVAKVRRLIQGHEGAGRAPNTVAALYATFRTVMGHAQELDLVEALPFPATYPGSPAGRRRDHVTLADVEAAIRATRAPWDVAAEVAYLTGLRVGELMAVTTLDVDVAAGVVHVNRTLTRGQAVNDPKTLTSRRPVDVHGRALDLLAERAAAVDAGARLFPGSMSTAGRALRDGLRAAGLYVKGRGWHELRHAHTALLDAAGMSIRDAAGRLGHGANMAQSMSYGWTAERADGSLIDAARARHADPT